MNLNSILTEQYTMTVYFWNYRYDMIYYLMNTLMIYVLWYGCLSMKV